MGLTLMLPLMHRAYETLFAVCGWTGYSIAFHPLRSWARDNGAREPTVRSTAHGGELQKEFPFDKIWYPFTNQQSSIKNCNENCKSEA